MTPSADPGPPTPSDAELTRVFTRSDRSPRDARQFVAGALADLGLDDIGSDAMLIVSELATNAVRHAESDFSVSISRTGSGVRIVVGDCDPAAPATRDPDLTGGRGLHIITALVSDWGHRIVDGGKLVWVTLPA